MLKKILTVSLLLAFCSMAIFAETVILQSGQRIRINEDFTWEYIPHTRAITEPNLVINHNGLLIEATSVRTITTFRDEKKAGIQFRVRNNTDHTVTNLRLRVYYIDVDGFIFYDQEFTLVNERSFSDNRVLRPNYAFRVPSESNSFLTADGLILEEWAEGQVALEIINLVME